MALYLQKDLDDDYHSRIGVWQITETEAELREITAALKTAIEIYDYDTALKNGELLAESVRNPELKELSKRFMDALDEFDWEQMGRLIRAMEEVYNSVERAGD